MMSWARERGAGQPTKGTHERKARALVHLPSPSFLAAPLLLPTTVPDFLRANLAERTLRSHVVDPNLYPHPVLQALSYFLPSTPPLASMSDAFATYLALSNTQRTSSEGPAALSRLFSGE